MTYENNESRRNAPAGANIRITDGDGNVLSERSAAKSGGNIIFSSPELEIGNGYTLQVGNDSYDIIMTETVTGSAGSGMMGGGFGGDPENGFGGGNFGAGYGVN